MYVHKKTLLGRQLVIYSIWAKSWVHALSQEMYSKWLHQYIIIIIRPSAYFWQIFLLPGELLESLKDVIAFLKKLIENILHTV